MSSSIELVKLFVMHIVFHNHWLLSYSKLSDIMEASKVFQGRAVKYILLYELDHKRFLKGLDNALLCNI